MRDEPLAAPKDGIEEYSGNNKKGFSQVILWITFFVTLIFTIYLWIASNSMERQANDAKTEKDEIISKINSPAWQDVENEANSFKKAYLELSQVSTERLPKAKLMTDLFTKFTKDVKISNLSITSAGNLGIDGTTGSYRQVAEFMLGIKSHQRVSKVTLDSVSVAEGEGIKAEEAITFSVSATISLEKDQATASDDELL